MEIAAILHLDCFVTIGPIFTWVANKSLLFSVIYLSRFAYIWAETCQLALTGPKLRLSHTLLHVFCKKCQPNYPSRIPNCSNILGGWLMLQAESTISVDYAIGADIRRAFRYQLGYFHKTWTWIFHILRSSPVAKVHGTLRWRNT